MYSVFWNINLRTWFDVYVYDWWYQMDTALWV